jgi:hypothetical protein
MKIRALIGDTEFGGVNTTVAMQMEKTWSSHIKAQLVEP